MDRKLLQQNIQLLFQQVEQAAPGRSVTIVAATKTRAPAEIQAAREYGIRAAGENRVQEFCEKLPAGAYEGLSRHFIGHLQTNKISKIVGMVDLIESVDSIHLLQAIDARAEKLGIQQDILAEINIGEEASKSGMPVTQLDEFLEYAAARTHIRVLGLMTVAPKAENDQLCQYFTQMYKLFIDKRSLACDNIRMEYLSMGMSGDYPLALSCGANMIRVGTGIFGPRDLNFGKDELNNGFTR